MVGYKSIYGTKIDILKIQNRKYQSVSKKYCYMNFILWMCVLGYNARPIMVKITWGNPVSSAALFYSSLRKWLPVSAAHSLLTSWTRGKHHLIKQSREPIGWTKVTVST